MSLEHVMIFLTGIFFEPVYFAAGFSFAFLVVVLFMVKAYTAFNNPPERR